MQSFPAAQRSCLSISSRRPGYIDPCRPAVRDNPAIAALCDWRKPVAPGWFSFGTLIALTWSMAITTTISPEAAVRDVLLCANCRQKTRVLRGLCLTCGHACVFSILDVLEGLFPATLDVYDLSWISAIVSDLLAGCRPSTQIPDRRPLCQSR